METGRNILLYRLMSSTTEIMMTLMWLVDTSISKKDENLIHIDPLNTVS